MRRYRKSHGLRKPHAFLSGARSAAVWSRLDLIDAAEAILTLGFDWAQASRKQRIVLSVNVAQSSSFSHHTQTRRLVSRFALIATCVVVLLSSGSDVAQAATFSQGNALSTWFAAADAPFENGRPPRTPVGLDACAETLIPTGDLPRGKGEALRYLVDVDGLSVGSVDFKIERRGMFKGLPVVEYRSVFKIDALVATFMNIDGRAATLVTSPGSWPAQAMNRYRLDDKQINEDMRYLDMGHTVQALESKDGTEKKTIRTFPTTVQDFLSAFYLARRLPNKPACVVIYGNERAYTAWIQPDGVEEIKTPAGLRMTDRFALKYSSDKGVRVISGHVWFAQDAERVPMRAQLDGPHKIEARLHLYQPGS